VSWRPRAVWLGAALGLCGVVAGAARAASELPARLPASTAGDEPLELTESGRQALQVIDADRREEQTVRSLEALSREKQQLLERAQINGRAYVRWVRLGLLPLSSGFAGFVTHANRVEALRRGLARDLARVAELDGQASTTRENLKQMRATREQLVRQVADYQRSREAVLAAEERESAYQRAFGSKSTTRHAAVYGAPAAELQARSFLELKGHMPFPVAGRAEVREVEPAEDRGPGVQLLLETGALARNVFRGRVVLIGDYSDLGRAVIVEHGSGYSTVFAHLGRVLVEVGDQVAAGAELGELAPSADGRGLLHFEVRHDGHALLPAEWLGL
jgi:murein hydrolase activator